MIFLLPVFGSVALCFLKDQKKNRGIIINVLLLLNAIFYLAPLAFAYLETPKGENMWSENGPGAILWSYLILLPLCGLAFIVLLIFKNCFPK